MHVCKIEESDMGITNWASLFHEWFDYHDFLLLYDYVSLISTRGRLLNP